MKTTSTITATRLDEDTNRGRPLVLHRFSRAAQGMHLDHGLPLATFCGKLLDAPNIVPLGGGSRGSVDCASCFMARVWWTEHDLPEVLDTMDWHPEYDAEQGTGSGS